LLNNFSNPVQMLTKELLIKKIVYVLFIFQWTQGVIINWNW